MVQKIPWSSASQVLRGGGVNPVSPTEVKNLKSPYEMQEVLEEFVSLRNIPDYQPEHKTL
jgi:hypothetical protein